jgi:hypothetical protein
MSRFLTYKLQPNEECEIKEFYRNIPTSGNLSFVLEREPSFYEALEVEGNEADVVVVKDSVSNKIVCAAIKSKKNCFIDGEIHRIGYLSGLRILEEYRNGQVLARLFRYFKEVQESDNCSFYITTIFDDNKHAQQILTSKKAGLPFFQDSGIYYTLIFKPQGVPSFLQNPYQIRRATEDDLDKISLFLHQEAKNKQFFPVYNEKDFNSKTGLLKGLDFKDIALLFHNEKLKGIMALWDQNLFRQWKIKAYSGYFKFIRPVINVAAYFKKMPLLPAANNPINYKTLALVCIENNNQQLFNLLLNELIQSEKKDNRIYIAAGFHQKDPFLQNFPFPNMKLKSKIFIVYWEKSTTFIPQKMEFIPYLELGSL